MIYRKQPNLLIVEDNQILAENFERILRADFSINISHTAGDAVSKIDALLPDLILLDILLSGHSAFALLNELQSYPDTFNIPIVICSDMAENLDEEALRHYGVVHVVDKSKVSPQKLREICKRAVQNE